MEVSDKEITEIVATLDTIYRSLGDRQHYLRLDGNSLSYTATKIATMKARMVDVKKLAEIDAKDAETQYKAIKAHALRRLVGQPLKEDGAKISATAASDLLYGEQDVIDAADDKTRKEATYNHLKSLVADGHDVIESIRGRLIDLQGSRKDERVG